MGLSRIEIASFALGTGLVLRYLIRIALPSAARRFESRSNRLSDTLRGEFVQMPASRIALVLIIAGLVLACFAIVATGLLIASIAGLIPALLAGTAIRWYRARRRKLILSRLPVLLDLLVGHLKAGHSFSESLAETIPLLPSGIREEMSWVMQKHRLGTPLVETFLLFEKRIPSEDVSLFVRPLQAALSSGGNLVDLLEQTRDILRRRNRSAEKLKSMTAQARLQAMVLTLITPVFALILSRIDSSFLPNLIGTPQGKIILAISVTLQVLGWITIKKILSVRP
ncbi:MAG: type II secretion system F family protein [Syntrophorhabdaceae bacterium]|nr:type II secretion system F family protein [Syntrophorhabdaceae bacterium]